MAAKSVTVEVSASGSFSKAFHSMTPDTMQNVSGLEHPADGTQLSNLDHQLYNYKATKGRAFLSDQKTSSVNLPAILPRGIPYAANYISFGKLRECGTLRRTKRNEVSISAEDLRVLYEARCLDQNLPPSWEREVRFMELISAKCKGNFFCLPENGFGVLSAEALASILSANVRYSILDLSGNRLRDDGVKFIAELLKVNRTIVHVDLASNDVGHLGGVAIANALQENNTVVSLDLGARSGANGNHIGSLGAEAIGKLLQCNEVLSHLNLSSNGLGAAGLPFIASALEHNKSLTHLNISSNNLGIDGARILSTVFDSSCITHLELPRNYLTDKGGAVLFEALAKAIENGSDMIQHIDLASNDLGEKSAYYLGKALATSTALKWIHLGGNLFGPAVKSITAGVTESHSLLGLFMNGCAIPEESGAVIGHALSTNNSLQELDVSNNRLKDKGACELAKGLSMNKHLLRCDLSSNKIGHNGGAGIAKALLTNATIRNLNLRRNMMLEQTGDRLQECLHDNKSVEKMDVSYNDFSYNCVIGIRHMLSRNAAINKQLLIPKLHNDIEILAPKEKDLERAEEDIELEKRMVRDRSEQLVRRSEEARVVAEKLRREVAELEKTFEKSRTIAEKAENDYRAVEDRVTNALGELKMKRTTVDARIQQEKDRIDKMHREMEKMRRQIKSIEDAEKEQLAPLFNEHETTNMDRNREMKDAKYEAEKLAALELKQKELEIALRGNSSKKKK